ncbi:MAG: hypothetical protein DHS20C14_02790 [Phycisphaeraceae bacterium]|nr:MAG: hypothetical protein DHS20C14_02790 [Phycisphaeraceae bacterium]
MLAVAVGTASAQEKVAQLPIRTDGPKSLDPVVGSTVYDNMACAQIYETLLVNKYAKPTEKEPLLLAEMPVSEDGGKTWSLKLKPGVLFHDNACFTKTKGKGRELVTDDVFYSFKRLADAAYELESWWLLKDTVEGFDEFKRIQNWRGSMPERASWLSNQSPETFKKTLFDRELKNRLDTALKDKDEDEVAEITRKITEQFNKDLTPADLDTLAAEFANQPAATFEAAEFDYAAPVAGYRKINDYEFEIELVAPVTRFEWVLTMFQTSIVAREAVEKYGDDFFRNPVGTGPFMLESWTPKKDLHLVRNPNYHEVMYPERGEWDRPDQRNRLHRAAGQQVPFLDRIEFTMYAQDQPMWLQFEAGRIGYTQVPDEYFPQAFDKRTKELLPSVAARGIRGHANKLLDFIFRGFNMDDELVGGYGPKKKALRQAISLAVDLNEFNETFYSGLNVVYDGPIPPGLDGYPEGGTSSAAYQGPNLDLARSKLAEAGYPDGEGLPPIKFYTQNGGNSPEQTELLQRQLSRIGVELDVQLVDFSTLIDAVNKKNAAMFSFAWSSDYPDGENNLALFYGPNEAPGANHYNYKRDDYDEMYEQILTMPAGDERTAIMVEMRDMILEDVPYVGSMARERHYVINPWLLNCKPTERYYAWFKFLDVDDSKRPER